MINKALQDLNLLCTESATSSKSATLTRELAKLIFLYNAKSSILWAACVADSGSLAAPPLYAITRGCLVVISFQSTCVSGNRHSRVHFAKRWWTPHRLTLMAHWMGLALRWRSPRWVISTGPHPLWRFSWLPMVRRLSIREISGICNVMAECILFLELLMLLNVNRFRLKITQFTALEQGDQRVGKVTKVDQ